MSLPRTSGAPRARPSRLFLAKFVAMVAIMGGSAIYASDRYVIGYDSQSQRCLDARVFLIDTWRKPSAGEMARGDLVPVAMMAHQRPAAALWPVGQVMVKRVLASEPGDVMHVDPDGVRFEAPGHEDWSWGTALEAAAKLGLSEAELTRAEVLGDGEFFLMGDRSLSYDSRYYGALHEEQVTGTVLWAF